MRNGIPKMAMISPSVAFVSGLFELFQLSKGNKFHATDGAHSDSGFHSWTIGLTKRSRSAVTHHPERSRCRQGTLNEGRNKSYVECFRR